MFYTISLAARQSNIKFLSIFVRLIREWDVLRVTPCCIKIVDQKPKIIPLASFKLEDAVLWHIHSKTTLHWKSFDRTNNFFSHLAKTKWVKMQAN